MRIGLIGASIRPAAVALAESNMLAIGIDWFADQETNAVLGSRSLVARDFKHAKALVMQFSKSPRIRKRRTSPGYCWVLAGGLDLQPQLLSTLTWSGSQILGCGLPAIRLAKSAELWTKKLGKVYQHVPPVHVESNTRPGKWHWKVNWPDSKHSGFWQKHIEGENRSAVFLAANGQVELIGVCRQFTTESNHPAGPYFYQGNQVLRPEEFADDVAALMTIGQWYAEQPEVAGLFGIDFIRNQEVWPIEINPRITASVEALAIATDRNLWLEHIEAASPKDESETETEQDPAADPSSTETVNSGTDQAEEEPIEQVPVAADPNVTTAVCVTECVTENDSITENGLGIILEGDTENVGAAETKFEIKRSVVKRIVYNRNQTLEIDQDFLDHIDQLVAGKTLNSQIQINQSSLEIFDRPKAGTTIAEGEPLCSIILSNDEAPSRDGDNESSRDNLWEQSLQVELELLDFADNAAKPAPAV